MKSNSLSVLLTVLFFLISIASFATNESMEKVIIGTDEWKPYISKEMKEFGACSHIVKEAFSTMGIEVEFVFRPWKRLLVESQSGKMDGISVWGGYETG